MDNEQLRYINHHIIQSILSGIRDRAAIVLSYLINITMSIVQTNMKSIDQTNKL
jgi:hypothetical protein